MDQIRTEHVKQVSATAVPDLVASNDIVLVEWLAPGCAACEAVHAEVHRAAQGCPDVLFIRVHADGAERDLAAELGVHQLPAFSIFRDRVLLYSRAGAMPHATLVDLVHQARGLDMAVVHEILAEAERDAALRS